MGTLEFISAPREFDRAPDLRSKRVIRPIRREYPDRGWPNLTTSAVGNVWSLCHPWSSLRGWPGGRQRAGGAATGGRAQIFRFVVLSTLDY